MNMAYLTKINWLFAILACLGASYFFFMPCSDGFVPAGCALGRIWWLGYFAILYGLGRLGVQVYLKYTTIYKTPVYWYWLILMYFFTIALDYILSRITWFSGIIMLILYLVLFFGMNQQPSSKDKIASGRLKSRSNRNG
jgi:hypothetical protein